MTAGQIFGQGSQCQRMVRAASKAYPYVDLSVLPVAPAPAGIAAQGGLTLSGEATGADVLTLTLATPRRAWPRGSRLRTRTPPARR